MFFISYPEGGRLTLKQDKVQVTKVNFSYFALTLFPIVFIDWSTCLQSGPLTSLYKSSRSLLIEYFLIHYKKTVSKFYYERFISIKYSSNKHLIYWPIKVQITHITGSNWLLSMRNTSRYNILPHWLGQWIVFEYNSNLQQSYVEIYYKI